MNFNNQPPVVSNPPASHSPSSFTTEQGNYFVEIQQGRSLRDYLFIFLRRKGMIIGIFLTIFLAGTLYTFLRTPIYRTGAMLQITQDNPGAQVSLEDKMSQLTGFNSLDEFKQSQYKILESRSLAWRVIKALNLEKHPDFRDIVENNQGKSEAEKENELKDRFLKKLEVAPIRNSSLVEVYFESPDKEMAQKVVQAIAEEYMYLSIDRRNESYTLIRKWLDKQLQDMAAKVQETQKKLYEFGWKTDIYTLEDKDNVIVQKFTDLSALLTKAQAERLAKEAQFTQIKEKGPDAPLIVNHPLIAELRKNLVAQESKISGLQKMFRPGHPELQAEKANLTEIRSRLQAEVKRLQESIKADYEAAMRTEKLLQESFASQKEEMAKLQKNLTQYQILKRDALTNEQLYQAILARVKEANIASTMVPSNVAVIDPPELPHKPYKPKKLRDLALAGFLGLILGVAGAILLESLDDSIKTTDDLEQICNLPSLGAMPLFSSNSGFSSRRLRKRPSWSLSRYLPFPKVRKNGNPEKLDMDLIMLNHPRHSVTEALRHLQTAIMLSRAEHTPSVILITSPNPGEGKSTVANNLALGFALNDHATVIIDCDLRRPRIHRIYNLKPTLGLSNYLTGNATLEEIQYKTPLPNLTMIPAGPISPNPVNLLNSKMFKELLATLRQYYQHIVIDSPPVLGFTDARIISQLVDAVILITRYQFTPKGSAKLVQQLFTQDHAPLIGAVLNGIDLHSQRYGGYYYHYKYYSKYYDTQLDDKG
jgi:succinoglycan biosynthesis transport protein ExoP